MPYQGTASPDVPPATVPVFALWESWVSGIWNGVRPDRSGLLGNSKVNYAGFLTMTAIFYSYTSSHSTYLSFLRVCEDIAVKRQSSRGPRVHSQGGKGKRLLGPLMSQKAVVHLFGIPLWSLLVFVLGIISKVFSTANSGGSSGVWD